MELPMYFDLETYLLQVWEVKMYSKQKNCMDFSGYIVSTDWDGVGEELTKTLPFLHENLTFG